MISTIASIQPRLWDEALWEELLSYLEEGRVIPIVGPSWTVEISGKGTTIETYIATKLTEKFGLEVDERESAVTLNDVVSRYLLKPGARRESLYPAIQRIVEGAKISPPQSLLRLASITDFNLFVSTSFDSLLEQAINVVRFNGEAHTKSIAYRRDKVLDIEIGKADLRQPTVYHLFGKLSASPVYAISDDDLLECLFALQSDNYPVRLFDELQNNHLLILGGNFSDWLARLFIRMTKRKRLSDPREVLEILADDRSGQDRNLVYFLSSFSSRTKIFTGNAAEFSEELWRRWFERNPEDRQTKQEALWTPPAEMRDGAVFISYAREDSAAVLSLAKGLRIVGIDCWFDQNADDGSGLRGGDNFDYKIRSCINRCSWVVVVLSRNTEARLEGYFRREWQFALDRSLGLAEHVPLIIPVVIDGADALKTLPKRLADLHRVALPGGVVTEPFAELLRSKRGRINGGR